MLSPLPSLVVNLSSLSVTLLHLQVNCGHCKVVSRPFTSTAAKGSIVGSLLHVLLVRPLALVAKWPPGSISKTPRTKHKATCWLTNCPLSNAINFLLIMKIPQQNPDHIFYHDIPKKHSPPSTNSSKSPKYPKVQTCDCNSRNSSLCCSCLKPKQVSRVPTTSIIGFSTLPLALQMLRSALPLLILLDITYRGIHSTNQSTMSSNAAVSSAIIIHQFIIPCILRTILDHGGCPPIN